MALDDLIVYKKSEVLLYKIYPTLANYPKSETHSLCLKIKEAFFDLLSHISLGNSVKSKRTIYLQQADGYLQTIKILMKLSFHLKYISEGFFKEVDLSLTEINKILAGYIRSSN